MSGRSHRFLELQDTAGEVSTLTETEIVAQAITELQQICAPVNSQGEASCTSMITVGEAGTTCSTDSNSFLSYLRNEDSGLNTGDVQVNEGDLLNEATQVIYYIEDGVVARSEKVLIDTSVQANDYEIERRSGRLPARKRVIPYKFRDYKNTSNEEDSDSDYEPDVKPKVKRAHREKPSGEVDQHEKILGVTPHRKPGRPRKHLPQSQTNSTDSSSTVPTSDGQIQNETESQPQREAGGQFQTEAGGQDQNETKEINVTVIKIKEEEKAEESKDHNETDDDAGVDDVEVIFMRKARGRPRGADWRKEYKCPECQKCFAQKGNLKTHLRTHTDERPFACAEENCGKFFRSQESLRRHILSHRGIKPFECDICHSKFSSNVGLQEHRSRHTDSKPHKCPHCPKHFRQVSCLRRHVLTHSSDKPYGCSVCAARFSQIAYLKSHMKVHTGCTTRFSQMANLKSHMKVQTGEKPYVCDICQKRFAHQSDVKRHKITHTGEKRYVCEICQAKFSDPSSKRRHEKEHSKKKAYICQLCDETFRRSGQLKAHLTSKHMLAVQIETDNVTGKSSLLFDTSELTDPMPANQRIAQLIRSLSTKTSLGNLDTGELEIPPVNNQLENQSQPVAMTTDHVTEISQFQQVNETELIETAGEHPVEFQGIEIQEEEVGGQTYIAITDLAESLLPNKGSADETGVTHYHIIQQITDEGGTHQVLVPLNETNEAEINAVIQETVEENSQGHAQEEHVQEHGPEENLNQAPEGGVSNVLTENKDVEHNTAAKTVTVTTVTESENTETIEAVAAVEQETAGQETAETTADQHKTIVFDYVTNPDFSSQDYYNWLSNFTELCKVVPMPLDVSLFQKISQVHKTVSDVMATPSGVVADKENFRVLMNITKELSAIINEHLVYILENLNPESKSKDNS